MNIDRIAENMARLIDEWIADLEKYEFHQLRVQPHPGSWSLGQLTIHLINETRYYFEQIKNCRSSVEHAGAMSEPGKEMFRRKKFPDLKIKGTANAYNVPQPDSREKLTGQLLALKAVSDKVAREFDRNGPGGKVKHPGLGWFNAEEWYQFAEMHFQHHLQQKKRIMEFLNA